MTEIEKKALALGLIALLCACGPRLTPDQRAERQRQRDQEYAELMYYERYQQCINRVTGLFSSASAEVMRECARLAKEGKSA